MKPEWAENAVADRIRRVGEWLSRGLDDTAILTRLLWFAIVPVPLFFFGLDWYALHVSEISALNTASKLPKAARLAKAGVRCPLAGHSSWAVELSLI